MGLFDTITVNVKLPGNCPTNYFQTKSLECAMYRYTVRSSGQLWQDWYLGTSEHGKERWRHYKDTFTGVAYVYDYIEKETGNEWWEYKLTFNNGKLIDKELIEAPGILRKE